MRSRRSARSVRSRLDQGQPRDVVGAQDRWTKGVGALVLAEGVEGLEAFLRGGGQELGRRAGTENVPGIAGFGAAAKARDGGAEGRRRPRQGLRDRLEHGLRQTPDALIFSDDVKRLPKYRLVHGTGDEGRNGRHRLRSRGVAVSSGSACSSGKVQPSHVLEAMGYRSEVSQGAVRLSLGWSTTETDVDLTLKAWRKLADSLVKGERRNTA